MPVSADTLRLLMARGITGDALIEVVASIDRDQARTENPRSGAALRQAKYRAKKKAEAESDVTRDVTNDVTRDAEIPPPKNLPHTPYKITPPQSSLRSVISGASPRKSAAVADAEAAQLLDRLRRVYPKRTGGDPRQTAMKALSRAIREGATLAAICDGADRFAKSRAGEDPKFVPMLATWLNQKRWQDDYGPPRKLGGGMSAMAKMAMGIFDDDERFDEHTLEPPASYGASADDPRAVGFAGRVSQPDRDDAGGPMFDLRPGDAGWE